MHTPQHPPNHVLELLGYNLGQRWAHSQNKDKLRARFEKYYTDWKNENLSRQRYESLHKTLDPASILAELTGVLNPALEDPEIAAAMLENYHLFEKGLVRGVMSALKSSKAP